MKKLQKVLQRKEEKRLKKKKKGGVKGKNILALNHKLHRGKGERKAGQIMLDPQQGN